ncbi:phage tail spike protein [Enterococcus thailandicus]|uniref:phage tail spike protein n=1 Tax=Enterococcus thailandicus TaxID=417368 RepID=UPI00288CA3E0|nr:phage tail spike protein [Enterococcus thailandicus]MDT2752349.1 phage tail spike protein [Enterococcus thailandicus]MDT2776844.1 phage tail spike protein [Enterococcus thailandicus]
MLRIKNLNGSITAILQNAFNVSYEKQTNSIWSASFCLPLDDPKVDKVQQLGYVEFVDKDEEYIGLFRVMPTETAISVENNRVKFSCFHVLSTLMDSVMFRYHEISPNTKTVDVLNYLLSLQKVAHWKLGKCEFTRYFQYSWENENGLIDAIWSIPQPFDEEYMWTFDTKSYPWTLNLVKPPTDVTARVWEGHNLKGFTVESNPNQLINRIYPLGQGEGINQLNIAKVNPTKKYYVEDSASIAKYGLIEYVWSDRRFTDANSLFSSTKALLNKWKLPIVSWSIDAVDLIKAIPQKPDQKIPKIDELRLNKVIQVKTKKFGTLNLRILKESKTDVFGNPQDLQLSVGYVPSDLGTTQADNERNIQINQLYSQGATNILNYDKADNCDPSYPVKFKFYIDDDVVKINTCELTFDTSAFRAYSKAIEGGGAVVTSTKAGGAIVKATGGGGGIVKSTSSGGYTASSTQSGGASVQSNTSESGGGSTQTSSANGSHRHRMFSPTDSSGPIQTTRYQAYGSSLLEMGGSRNDIYTAEAADNHSHNVTIPAHTHRVSINIPAHSHNFTVPNHTHEITLPDHTHEINLPSHTHEITLPDHTHEIEYGIYEASERASQVRITVDNNAVSGTEISKERFNLVPYLQKNEDGTIQKGWHEIVMTPNNLARIEAQVTLRVFIKSQLGGEF